VNDTTTDPNDTWFWNASTADASVFRIGDSGDWIQGRSPGFAFSLTLIPVPSTLLLFGTGFTGLVAWQWREQRRVNKFS